METSDAVVSKAEFARICNVSPGRVTQWIAERKIRCDALVGDGRSAKIRVELAQQQLRLRRDVGQACGNGLDTRLTASRHEAAAVVDPGAGETSADAVEEQIKREKLEALQRRNREEAENERARQGRYTETAAARREMAKVADQMMRVFEGSLTELATAVHARFQLEQREVLHLLREEFRKVRAKAADAAASAAAELPELVEDAEAAEA